MSTNHTATVKFTERQLDLLGKIIRDETGGAELESISTQECDELLAAIENARMEIISARQRERAEGRRP